MKEEIILPDSPETAEYKTITGWFSRNGKFYGDRQDSEQLARLEGSTHCKCECGKIHRKYNLCSTCSEKVKLRHYESMPFKEWDETTPVYSESEDRYFYSSDEIDDYLEDYTNDDGEKVTGKDLRLILCDRVTLPTIDEDYFMDNAPEGYELEDMVSKKFMLELKRFNKKIQSEQVNAWEPGEFRTEYLGCDRT